MADTERENPIGFIDKRRTQASNDTPLVAANYEDVAGLRTRLTAINAAYYTSTRLNQMTKNDMVYAVRLADDAASI